MVRLNKYLKDAGICSRRKADDFIAKGYIKINGKIVTELGIQVDPEIDKIEVLPQVDQEKSQFRYILLNKPTGYVCSKSLLDGMTIFELLPPNIPDLTYAGRLDKDSHGLLILSNDGKFVYSIAGAEHAVEKEYLVRVNKPLTPNYLYFQRSGIIKLDSKLVKPAQVEQVGPNSYKIILKEGVHRQIRRMAEHQGYTVLELQRIRIGKITDSKLPLGQWRDLSADEVELLRG